MQTNNLNDIAKQIKNEFLIDKNILIPKNLINNKIDFDIAKTIYGPFNDDTMVHLMYHHQLHLVKVLVIQLVQLH